MLLTERFEKALSYAAQVHSGQVRKGTTIPYVSHLLIVAGIALEYGATEDEAIGALLHDAGEDGQGQETIDEIADRFGRDVADIVLGCSDTIEAVKPDWRERKENYLDHLKMASRSVCFVSACDKLHNVTAIHRDLLAQGDAVWDRFKGKKSGTLWYYRSLVEAYREHQLGPILDALDAAVTALETDANS